MGSRISLCWFLVLEEPVGVRVSERRPLSIRQNAQVLAPRCDPKLFTGWLSRTLCNEPSETRCGHLTNDHVVVVFGGVSPGARNPGLLPFGELALRANVRLYLVLSAGYNGQAVWLP